MYNYLDYRVKNNTGQTFQIFTWVTDEYLCGELRCERELPNSWHIQCEEERFIKETDIIYREGKIYRSKFDKKSGNLLEKELLQINHAQVMYKAEHLLKKEEV